MQQVAQVEPIIKVAARQTAPLALDAAAALRFDRERSPPRGDRRPLSKRNKSREERAAAGGAKDETYGQIRAKAVGARSKTVPAEIFIGEAPKRSKAVPPNQSALNHRAARTAAVKREASAPAEDRRVRARGGAANAERAALRQQLAKNPRLYEDKQGNIKAKRPAKSAHLGAKKSAKSASLSPERAAQGARPEDRYGVRSRRAPAARGKSLGASASRSRDERVGLVV